MTPRALLAALVASATVAVVPGALAQQTPQTPQHGDAATMNQMEQAGGGSALDAQARSHFRVGLTLYQEGRFRDSAAEFQQAYDLSHRSQLLYNIYLAWRDAGDVPQSTEALRRYLAETPDDGSEQRHALAARLASLQESVSQAQQQTQATEQQHQQELAAQQAEAERQRQAAEEARQRAEAAQREAASHRPLGPSIPGIVIGGVGLAAVVAGVIIGGVGLSQAGDFSGMCNAMTHTCPPSTRGLQDSARLLTGLGDGLWIGGAAVAITGLILFLLKVGSSPEGPPPPATASAMCGPNGCSAELTLHL